MENMKKQFEELKANGKLVVEVIQNGKVSDYWLDEKSNAMQLLGFLYSKTVINKKYRITYHYNYSDKQTISITDKYENFDGTFTKTQYKFYNVPTNMGYLDTYKLSQILEV